MLCMERMNYLKKVPTLAFELSATCH
jgi:hypothetical protein